MAASARACVRVRRELDRDAALCEPALALARVVPGLLSTGALRFLPAISERPQCNNQFTQSRAEIGRIAGWER